MPTSRSLAALLLVMCAPAAAAAETALDLKLPAPEETVAAIPAEAAASPAPSKPMPTLAGPLQAQFDANDPEARPQASAPACDDRSYGQAQVHGSIGMGVVAGSHVSGNYQTGTVEVTKALGSCDDPKGVVDVSISIGQDNIKGRRRGRP